MRSLATLLSWMAAVLLATPAASAELSDAQLAHIDVAGFSLKTRLRPDGRPPEGLRGSSTAPHGPTRRGRTLRLSDSPTTLSFACPERGGRVYRITHSPDVSGVSAQLVLRRIVEKYGEPDVEQKGDRELYWYWTDQEPLPKGDDFRYDFHGLMMSAIVLESGLMQSLKLELHSVEGQRAVDQCEVDRLRSIHDEKASNLRF